MVLAGILIRADGPTSEIRSPPIRITWFGEVRSRFGIEHPGRLHRDDLRRRKGPPVHERREGEQNDGGRRHGTDAGRKLLRMLRLLRLDAAEYSDSRSGRR